MHAEVCQEQIDKGHKEPDQYTKYNSDKDNCQNTDDEMEKHMVTVKSFSFNNLRSNIITRLETSSRQRGAKIKYKIETGSDDILMSLNTSIFQTSKHYTSYVSNATQKSQENKPRKLINRA